MEIVQTRITSTVVTAPYGTLMPGTILRTSPAYAKHLVEEAFAASYITTHEAVFSGAGSALTMDVGRESLERIA